MKVTPKLNRRSIVLSYKISNKLYEYFIGITVEPERWSTSKKLIKGEGAVIAEKNRKIKRYKGEIELFVLELEKNKKEYFHEELKDYLKGLEGNESNESSKDDVLSYFDKYLEAKQHLYANQTVKAYKTTKRHLTKYIATKGKKSIAFASVTKLLLNDFNKFLNLTLNLSPATRGKHLKNLKAIMSEASSLGLHSNSEYKSVQKESENSINIYLSIQEIKSLIEFEKFSKNERLVIDVFAFICLTGLRYTDYFNLNKYNFFWKTENGKEVLFIGFLQDKTKEDVEVPIMYSEAINIAKKYEYSLPKYANAYLNRYIKSIFKKHKLFETYVIINKEKISGEFIKRDLITLHTGRRSFCTNQYLKGTPTQFIMAASGHKTESAFRLYIKADQLDKAKGLLDYLNY